MKTLYFYLSLILISGVADGSGSSPAALPTDGFFPGEDLRFSSSKGAPYLKTANQTAGAAVSMTQLEEAGKTVFLFGTKHSGELKITVYGPDTLRIQWHWTHPYPKDEVSIKYAEFTPAERLVVSSGEAPEYFWVKTSAIEARVRRTGTLGVDFYCAASGRLISRDGSLEFNPSYEPREDDSYSGLQRDPKPPQAFKVKNTKRMDARTAFLGLGDWAGPINRRGHRIQFWNEDAYGWHEYQSPKYTSFPVLYSITPSTHGGVDVYGIFFNNTSRSLFDLGDTSEDAYSFEAADGQIDYFFFFDGRGSVDGPVNALTRITGRSALLPKWGYGYHMSRFTYLETDLDQILDNFVFTDTPLSAVFIDLDYMDQTENPTDRNWELQQFSWNKAGYPQPERIIERLARRGIFSSIIVEPFLDAIDEKFDFARERGFLVETIEGEPVTQSIWCAEKVGWIDFTNKEARDWWRGELSSFLKKYGIRGVWNDLNETADVGGIPLDGNYRMDGKFSDRTDSRRWHLNVKNTHNLYSTKVSYEAILQAWPGERPFVLGRGGFPGVQKWAAGWSGDNVASSSHLRHNIRAGVSIALCGFSNYGHDIGGFTGHPSFRIFQRWHEWSAFTPLMRNHSGNSNPRRDPFFYSGEERALLERTIRWRYYFLPHIYSLAHQCSLNGWPINSPVAAVFPDEEESFYLHEYDFMAGRDILLAPVVFEFDNERVVRFPGGKRGDRWHSFWLDESYTGGSTVKVKAGLGMIPLFIRHGGVIAVNPDAWTMSSPDKSNVRFSSTQFHLWGGNGDYHFYDDDGISLLSSPDRERMTVSLRVQSHGRNTVVQVKSQGQPNGRNFSLVFRGEQFGGGKFFVDGREVKGVDISGNKSRGESWTGREVKIDLSKGSGCVVTFLSQ